MKLDKVLSYISLTIYIGLIVSLFTFENSVSWIWTIVIPLLPLLMVVGGYNRFRNICPLAYISKLAQNINIVKKRKVGLFLENNYYYLQFSLLFIAFYLRLILLNNNSMYVGIFFILVSIIAMLTSVFISGKTWCNFLCPVGFVEKLYTLSNTSRYGYDSACSTCSACKKNCPDIDIENSYWKDDSLKSKQSLFYAFSGLVLGFYVYYYLKDGSWNYYFGGSWTSEVFSIYDIGFYFDSTYNIAVAAFFTLSFFSIASYMIFYLIERMIIDFVKVEDISTFMHKMRVLSGYVAFNIFYIFAGAPSYSNYPFLYAFFHFIVISVSTAFLYRELFRSQAFFLQERFARNILKRQGVSDISNINLKEIYYTYVNAKKDKQKRLSNYKSSVIELIRDGIINTNSFSMLEVMREQMELSEDEHQKIISEVKKEYCDFNEATFMNSAEKHRQLDGYKRILKAYIDKHTSINQSELELLQAQFDISDQEHNSIYNDLINSDTKLKSEIIDKLVTLTKMSKITYSIKANVFIEYKLLQYAFLSNLKMQTLELFELLYIVCRDNKSYFEKLKNEFYKNNEFDVDLISRKNMQFVDIDIYNNFSKYFLAYKLKEKINLDSEHELMHLAKKYFHDEISVAVNTYVCEFFMLPEVDASRYLGYINSNSLMIKEIGYKLQKKVDDSIIIEIMAYLHGVSIFETLRVEELYELAKKSIIKNFNVDDYLIREGDDGEELYIITHGKASIHINKKYIIDVGTGDYVGEISIITDQKRTASVKAITSLRSIVITSDDFNSLILNNPYVSIRIMKDLTSRILDIKDIKKENNE